MSESLSAAQFKLSALNDRAFEGYTSGTTWNGWETPAFEYDVAVTILRASEANGYRWKYDAIRTAFVVEHIDDPDDYAPEVFPAIEVAVDGLPRTLYPVGSYSWVWERRV